MQKKAPRFLVVMAGEDEAYASCVMDRASDVRSFRRRYSNAPEIREVDGAEMQRLMTNYLNRVQRRAAQA